jgi:hypothetical protein
MRKVRQVLRLAWEAGLGQRQIGRSLGMSPATVGAFVRRAQLAGLSWPVPGALDDGQLEARIFPSPPTLAPNERALPNWAKVNEERKRKGVTYGGSATVRQSMPRTN